MTCAACAQASERAVKKVSGVENASVNFATEMLSVKFDAASTEKGKEIGKLKAKFAFSAAFAFPLLYIAMGAMLGWPLPAFMNAMNFPLRYALIEIALVLPVLVAGYRFYLVGFRAIAHGAPNIDSLSDLWTT